MKKLLFFSLSIFLSFTGISQDAPLWLRFPAISPDGQQIAFCYQGDIYKVSVNGGTAVPLTINEAYDSSPIWSPDGQKIAFSSDRFGNTDVFVVDQKGGTPERLTYHSSNDTPSDFSPNSDRVLFTSTRTDAAENQMYPYWGLPELYSISINGGRPKMELTIAAENAKFSPDGNEIIYQDIKGYENRFRKHHTSSVTRDIWAYSLNDKSFRKITAFNGEDRNPVFNSNEDVFYLNEESGSFNIYKMQLNNEGEKKQISHLENHPVRYLTMSDDGLLCFSYRGELYTLREGEEPVKLQLNIYNDSRYQPRVHTFSGKVSDMSSSSNGKEIAFIHRGDVFVTSIETELTKQVTSTPEQERNVQFSPDGKSLVYAGERGNSWNIYRADLAREDEKYFYNSTILLEQAIVSTDAEEFQPAWSPDGKEIAYIENRTTLRVINLDSKESRTILSGDKNYSYADGDQHYAWSPDSKWFIVDFLQDNQWISEVGLVNAKGDSEPVNLTNSGYNDYAGSWGINGSMFYYFSDRDGMKNQSSWGGQDDVYAMFFNKKSFDEFNMTKEELSLYKGDDDKKDEEKDDDSKDEKDDKKKKEKIVKPLHFDLNNIADRKVKLTNHSSNLGDVVITEDGEKMYYTSKYDKQIDLWEMELRTKESSLLMKLGDRVTNMEISKDSKFLFVISDGNLSKIDLTSKKNSPIKIKGEMVIDEMAERDYFFEHIWRQAKDKFYKKDLHGVDWDLYKSEYKRFLPYINNNQDFAIMASELLGELNASHTGCRYFNRHPNGDATASLGLFYDQSHNGAGLKIQEVIRKSPVIKEDSKIMAGVIIEKINGTEIKVDDNYYQLLNRIVDKQTLLSLYNPITKSRWQELVKPISMAQEMNLRYDRWVENCKKITHDLSNGKIGYVHVRGMNNESFKEVYSNALGENYDKESLIVDTRFNGGGWLHDDMVTFLNGKKYMSLVPRGQKLGNEPSFKWTKPSAVIMSEGNYSDAHLFPAAYKLLGIGKLIGMPVAGTGTAVWWERLHNDELVFGIPQVGMVDNEGNYMENYELQPDYKVMLTPEKVSQGEDEQIAKAIQVLLGTAK